jgi:hypothetical protein
MRPAHLLLGSYPRIDCTDSNDGDADSDNGSESDSHK